MVLISICLDGNSQIACTFTHFKNTSYQIKKGNNIIFLLLTILCIIIMYVPFITIKHAINKSHDQNLVQIHWKQFIYWIAASYVRNQHHIIIHQEHFLYQPIPSHFVIGKYADLLCIKSCFEIIFHRFDPLLL